MAGSRKMAMSFKSYGNHAEGLVKDLLLSDPYIPYTAILSGILACKLVNDLVQLLSASYFKSYNGLNKAQRIEWNNRGISSIHAVFIAVMSLYFVFWSDLFSDKQFSEPLMFRSSALSTFALGVSVGYFIADLGMILWLYPSLGGMEYVVHHSFAGVAVAYAIFFGEGQLYTYMILISEVSRHSWFEEVCCIYHKWCHDIYSMAGCKDPVVCLHVLPCLLALQSGYPNAHDGLLAGFCGAFSSFRNELSLVWKDSKGFEEGPDEAAAISENRSRRLMSRNLKCWLKLIYLLYNIKN